MFEAIFDDLPEYPINCFSKLFYDASTHKWCLFEIKPAFNVIAILTCFDSNSGVFVCMNWVFKTFAWIRANGSSPENLIFWNQLHVEYSITLSSNIYPTYFSSHEFGIIRFVMCSGSNFALVWLVLTLRLVCSIWIQILCILSLFRVKFEFRFKFCFCLVWVHVLLMLTLVRVWIEFSFMLR